MLAAPFSTKNHTKNQPVTKALYEVNIIFRSLKINNILLFFTYLAVSSFSMVLVSLLERMFFRGPNRLLDEPYFIILVLISLLLGLLSFKFNKKVILFIGAITAFIIINFTARELVILITETIAKEITNSVSSYNPRRILWDTNLKIAMYCVYALSLVIIYSIITKVSKLRILIEYNRLIPRIIFILCFPTITPWGISVINMHEYSHWLITPLVIAPNPISILLTGFIAYLISKRVFKINGNV